MTTNVKRCTSLDSFEVNRDQECHYFKFVFMYVNVCVRERDLFLSVSTMAVTILADSLLISHLIDLSLVKPLNKKAIHRVYVCVFVSRFSRLV